jgi:hypothetical protein
MREDIPCRNCAVYPKLNKYITSMPFPALRFIGQTVLGKIKQRRTK